MKFKVIILRPILYNVKVNFSSRREHFLADVGQLRSRHIGKFVHASEFEVFFWPKLSEFAVKSD